MKHIVPDQTGYPRFTVAMLKTPLYTDPKQFVWRGLVAMPFPNPEYWKSYELRKDEHIKKLKSQYGNTLTPVGIDAIKIYNKYHDDLITKTRDGLVKPVKDELMDTIVSKEIGTRKYTNKGYGILKAQMREAILKEYAKANDDRLQEVEQRKENARLEKRELVMLQIEEAKRIKEAKLEAFKVKVAEDKRRNDLKEKALLIRQRELERAREIKEEKAKAKEEKESDSKW